MLYAGIGRKRIGVGLRLLLVIGVLGALNACATPAQPRPMVPQSVLPLNPASDSALHGAIALAQIGGGEETKPWLASKVGDEELHEALRLSLQEYGFLNTSDAEVPFHLEVFLIDLKQPISGFEMIVNSIIRYKLVRAGDGQVVYDEIITASYKATVDDAFYGVKRLQLANEGSIRANIGTFLEQLNSLAVADTPLQ